MNSVDTTLPHKTLLSEWEMKTHAQGALRVLGLPFGVTDRAMELLVWAHGVQGGTVEFLVARQDEVQASANERIAVVDEDNTSAELDANGQTIFAVGPAVIDLACAMSTAAGKGCVTAANVLGTEFSAELAHRGASRGVHCLVTTSEGGWLGTPDGQLRSVPNTSPELTVTCGETTHHAAGGRVVDVADRLASAQSEGYPTDPEAATAFLALGHKLWLPSSERSRAQGSGGDKSLENTALEDTALENTALGDTV